ncbi:ABC transporter substrate-binding protein [Cohnella hashimotonis]|uniref:Sugar ABC transporter substrate-binding protein n=1 Tax=Cohnella hashimotonis TaxID=2826895 RepID=A0ABT6TMN3_9BACL|nr:sugar ABC transporter substrate-binding protein [Cohnella hashimotonis]MDI4647097.1 sugar ABC transporter substrate-binding protein [Cohnella hashimotonis]
MRIGKKQYALMAAAALTTLSLSACGGNSDDNAGTASKSSDASKQVTLTVWGDQANQSSVEGAFKAINQAFEEKHPNIKLDFQYAGTEASIDTAVKSNSLPDVFFVQGNKTPKMDLYVNSGSLLPLDEYGIDVSRYDEAALDYAKVNDKLYASPPAFMDSQLIYYNKDIFDKHGLKVPTTLDEFAKLADSLKAAGITPFSVPGKTEFERAWLAFALAPVTANDALGKIDAGNGTFKDPGIVKAFQTIRDFADKGYYTKDLASVDNAGAQLAFTNGKTAMMADGTWNDPTFAGSGMNLGRFYIPGADGKRIAAQSFSNLTTYAVAANTKHPAEAAEYVKFLTTQEAQQLFENETGAVPSLQDIQPRDESVKELSSFDSLGYNIYSVLTDVSTENVKLTDIFMQQVMPKLLTSQIDGQQAADLLEEALLRTK